MILGELVMNSVERRIHELADVMAGPMATLVPTLGLSVVMRMVAESASPVAARVAINLTGYDATTIEEAQVEIICLMYVERVAREIRRHIEEIVDGLREADDFPQCASVCANHNQPCRLDEHLPSLPPHVCALC